MKTNKIWNKILVSGLVLAGVTFSSCDDFLTVLPTDRVTEDDFWKTETDLQNARAACYRQMCTFDVTTRILYWGEIRSDNMTLNNMTQEDIKNVQQGMLMPANGMFKWDAFYTGINYCNLVLEQGEKMTEPGNEVDPAFRRSDWLPIKAEVTALRALYYFYLVRAYRDVPYVTAAVRTDEEARARKDGQTLGVVILGKLIDDLEAVAPLAAENFGSTSDNCGRFTKRGVHALLADIYLWRACMLVNSATKGDVLLDDEGNQLGEAAINKLRTESYKKAIEHSDYILNYFQSEYDRKLAENPGPSNGDDADRPYPYLTKFPNMGNNNVSDYLYSVIWDEYNPTEMVFELKYDAASGVSNDALYTYCSNLSNGALIAGYMTGSSMLASSAQSSYDPERGFGKTDVRLLETLNYTPSSSSLPLIHKNILGYLNIKNLEDMTEGAYAYWLTDRSQNWPVYRLTDVMLIKAEAIARSVASSTNAKDDENVKEGFRLVNEIFKRNNPRLQATGTSGAGQMVSDRLKDDYATSGDGKTAANLLNLVYNERQREFVAEGKRWFDIVRQCEATDQTVTDVLTNFISLQTAVRNRLKLLYSLYNPVNEDEIKVNGEEFGGNLKQNSVWQRYSSK